MQINGNEQFIKKLFIVVEKDFDGVLTELEIRNSKQMAQMEIIKNMVNECIRELFENFEIDIEDTYTERKTSISSKVRCFFEENQEIYVEFEKESDKKNKEKLRISPIDEKNEKNKSENMLKAEKNSEKEASVKSETKNIEENAIHDISFSINQSHDVKNGMNKELTVFINGIEPNNFNHDNNKQFSSDEKNATNEKRDKTPEIIKKNCDDNEKKEQKTHQKIEKEPRENEKKNEKKNEKNEKGEKKEKDEKNNEKTKEKLEKLYEKLENTKPEKKLKHENSTSKKVNKTKNESEFEKSKLVLDSEKKQKDKKLKDKAFKSYIAPHSATSKTIQEYINNSNCKKISQTLNESNPSNPSSQIIAEQNIEKHINEKILLEKNINEKTLEKNIKEKTIENNIKEKTIEKNIDKNGEKTIKNEALSQKTEKKKEENKQKTSQESHISHNRNKSEDILLKKKEEHEDFAKKKEEYFVFEKKSPEKNTSKNDYSSERSKENSGIKKNPLSQNKFLNYYYFFEEKKDTK